MACYTDPASAPAPAISLPSATITPSSHPQHSPFANKDVFESLALASAKVSGNSRGNGKGRGKGGSSNVSVMYVIGDSHVLSSAYAVVSLSKRRVALVPKLVTGVKQWHLRKESHFYPKEIFRRTLASVPPGSEVILLLGEIDCREGLLSAVQKGVYENVLEAMQATLGVFRQVVRELVEKKRLKVSEEEESVLPLLVSCPCLCPAPACVLRL